MRGRDVIPTVRPHHWPRECHCGTFIIASCRWYSDFGRAPLESAAKSSSIRTNSAMSLYHPGTLPTMLPLPSSSSSRPLHDSGGSSTEVYRLTGSRLPTHLARLPHRRTATPSRNDLLTKLLPPTFSMRSLTLSLRRSGGRSLDVKRYLAKREVRSKVTLHRRIEVP